MRNRTQVGLGLVVVYTGAAIVVAAKALTNRSNRRPVSGVDGLAAAERDRDRKIDAATLADIRVDQAVDTVLGLIKDKNRADEAVTLANEVVRLGAKERDEAAAQRRRVREGIEAALKDKTANDA